ncbi:DUF3568 family protein [Coraliomargarita sp. SDUM461003]|uniref:DUF3568 family protein n=1 Tax=Thalassobacterium maritimum TaxID=3041265 RepID=A0ABU1ASK2_9BACT|nr:DUF3568 family protein [Coraliomargarita sp. SDUM461003]MBT62603.1 hypothetical protein [Puniceicoccaceae bacterium]MDQ8206120.1 DUF3568 family protein [Coraliomargarita sp. SDUM461003]|tara:strand:- start:16115 stop:16507 length:393 start_codon:yes stop_codon:yes gene_type:complete
MNKYIHAGFVSALLLGASFQFSGCVAIVAGGAAAGGTAYALGDLTVAVDASSEQLEQAIRNGARDLGLQFINGSGDQTAGKYLFRNASDQKITVSYRTKSPVYYEMSIRVGTFGDEAIASSLSQSIQKYL